MFEECEKAVADAKDQLDNAATQHVAACERALITREILEYIQQVYSRHTFQVNDVELERAAANVPPADLEQNRLSPPVLAAQKRRVDDKEYLEHAHSASGHKRRKTTSGPDALTPVAPKREVSNSSPLCAQSRHISNHSFELTSLAISSCRATNCPAYHQVCDAHRNSAGGGASRCLRPTAAQ